MIAGLPWTSWLLILSSAGIGLLVVAVFYSARRGDPDEGREPRR